MRNSVNRLVNCETANLNKTVSAAMKQVESIKLIDKEIGIENLPDRLREIARIRGRTSRNFVERAWRNGINWSNFKIRCKSPIKKT